MTPVVEVKDLTISYDPTLTPAVNGVSFEVGSGEVLGLLGGNGAGKTSTLRALAGIQPSTGGNIFLAGFDLNNRKEDDLARQVVGYCPDTAGILRQGTVREHIGLALALRGKILAWPAALDLVEKFGLSHVLDRETLGFSHGMSRRLSVLLAALTAEKVLLLDEPFDGVDPLGVQATQVIIAAAKEAGLAVIVSTHLLPLLTEVADRVAVMVNGKIVDEAASEEFVGNRGSERYATKLAGN